MCNLTLGAQQSLPRHTQKRQMAPFIQDWGFASGLWEEKREVKGFWQVWWTWWIMEAKQDREKAKTRGEMSISQEGKDSVGCRNMAAGSRFLGQSSWYWEYSHRKPRRGCGDSVCPESCALLTGSMSTFQRSLLNNSYIVPMELLLIVISWITQHSMKYQS